MTNTNVNITKTLGMLEGTITFTFNGMIVTVFINASKQQLALTKMGLIRFAKKMQTGETEGTVGITVVVDFDDIPDEVNEELKAECLDTASKMLCDLVLEDKLEVFYN